MTLHFPVHIYFPRQSSAQWPLAEVIGGTLNTLTSRFVIKVISMVSGAASIEAKSTIINYKLTTPESEASFSRRPLAFLLLALSVRLLSCLTWIGNKGLCGLSSILVGSLVNSTTGSCILSICLLQFYRNLRILVRPWILQTFLSCRSSLASPYPLSTIPHPKRKTFSFNIQQFLSSLSLWQFPV